MQYKVMYWNMTPTMVHAKLTMLLLYNLLHSTMLYNFNLSIDRSHVLHYASLSSSLYPVTYNSSISLLTRAHARVVLDGASHCHVVVHYAICGSFAHLSRL
jgi:serine acetyltransferase